VLLLVPCQAEIVYVDADANGANDGSSWASAYNYLQNALADADSHPDVNEIRVGQGIYKPDQSSANPDGSGARTATFQLINGVVIKGGYAGFGAPNPNARKINVFRTILSGDLEGNDVDVNDPEDLLGEPTRQENSYHVVRASSGTDANAVLDGFTIAAGNANGSSPHDNGGGMHNFNSSPTVAYQLHVQRQLGGPRRRDAYLRQRPDSYELHVQRQLVGLGHRAGRRWDVQRGQHHDGDQLHLQRKLG
jgi:hypothetical protein